MVYGLTMQKAREETIQQLTQQRAIRAQQTRHLFPFSLSLALSDLEPKNLAKNQVGGLKETSS